MIRTHLTFPVREQERRRPLHPTHKYFSYFATLGLDWVARRRLESLAYVRDELRLLCESDHDNLPCEYVHGRNKYGWPLNAP